MTTSLTNPITRDIMVMVLTIKPERKSRFDTRFPLTDVVIVIVLSDSAYLTAHHLLFQQATAANYRTKGLLHFENAVRIRRHINRDDRLTPTIDISSTWCGGYLHK
ncbi:hypothetical protein [Veronia pacifica]|uniref:hypothetical protein n=1 Tax=Veronia pacifica TaxID=1080227 RepID=UPI001585EB38|nr:hypothetical protein [Veronia pacifica]